MRSAANPIVYLDGDTASVRATSSVEDNSGAQIEPGTLTLGLPERRRRRPPCRRRGDGGWRLAPRFLLLLRATVRHIHVAEQRIDSVHNLTIG